MRRQLRNVSYDHKIAKKIIFLIPIDSVNREKLKLYTTDNGTQTELKYIHEKKRYRLYHKNSFSFI